MSTPGWTFLTNHTHVLVCIDRDPGVTMRTVAERVGITERAVQRIVQELVEEGYLSRSRQGRRNAYRLEPDRPLRHRLESGTHLGALLKLLNRSGEG
jgi:predicted ArsR family transcriptional regulator